VGLVLRAEGDTAGARSMFEGSLRAGRREGAGLGLPLGLLGLAHVAGDLGDWERAGTLHGAAQAAAHRLGASNAAIAAALYVTVNTVRTHLDRIRGKTGARSRADLTRYALLAGIEPTSIPVS